MIISLLGVSGIVLRRIVTERCGRQKVAPRGQKVPRDGNRFIFKEEKRGSGEEAGDPLCLMMVLKKKMKDYGDACNSYLKGLNSR